MTSKPTDQPLSWHETLDGSLQCQLHAWEQLNALVGDISRPSGQEAVLIHTAALLQHADGNSGECEALLIPALRSAWRDIRIHERPELGIQLAKQTKTYRDLSDSELRAWLEETFVVAPANSTLQACVAAPRFTAQTTCTVIPSSSGQPAVTILIQTSHWRHDMLGCIHLLFRLVSRTGQTFSGYREHPLTTLSRTSPNVLSLVNGNACRGEETKQRVAMYLDQFVSSRPILRAQPSIKAFNDNVRRGTQGTHIILDQGSTNSLLIACKARHMSVTNAFHSALICQLRSSAPDELKDRPWASLLPIDLRRRLSDKSSSEAALAYTALFPIVPAGLTFEEQVQCLASQIDESRRASWMKEDGLEIGEQFMSVMAAGDADFGTVWSGLGNLDDNPLHRTEGCSGALDGWRIDSLRLGLGVTDFVAGYCWTFRGKLNISFSYDQAYFHEGAVRALGTGLLDTISAEMGIQIALDPVR